jgi:hypothetical protein
VENRLRRFRQLGVDSERVTGIGIPIELGKIAAGNLHPHPVTGQV